MKKGDIKKKDTWEGMLERVSGRRSFLGKLARGAYGFAVAAVGIKLSEATVQANECTLCQGSTSGCSSSCHEDEEICSWGWVVGDGCPQGTAVCFECFYCSQGYCGGVICSEVLCF